MDLMWKRLAIRLCIHIPHYPHPNQW